MTGKIKRLIWLWIQCFKSMRVVKIFVPLLIYAIFQLLLLFSLSHFTEFPFSGFLVPFVRNFFGEVALHYPNFYFILASLYGQGNIVLSGVIRIVLVAMATYLFAAYFSNAKPNLRKAFKVAVSHYGVLFMIWFLASALTLMMVVGLPYLMNRFLQPGYMLSRVFDVLGFLLGLVATSMFAYATVLVVLRKQKLAPAISNTFSIFFQNAGTSFFLIAIPTVFYLPIRYLSRRVDLLFAKYSPETIITVLAIGIFISLLSSYFQIGSITRFYLLLADEKKRSLHRM